MSSYFEHAVIEVEAGGGRDPSISVYDPSSYTKPYVNLESPEGLGWELVTVVDLGVGYYAFWKREIPESERNTGNCSTCKEYMGGAGCTRGQDTERLVCCYHSKWGSLGRDHQSFLKKMRSER